MTTEQIIASNIIEARKQKGWTQEQAAEKIGIKRQALGKIEKAINSPTVATLDKISKAFEINIVELLKENHED